MKHKFLNKLLLLTLFTWGGVINPVCAQSETVSYGWETADDASKWTITGITATSGQGNTGSYAGMINTANTYIQFKEKVAVTSFSFALKRISKNTNYYVYVETSTDGTEWSAAATYEMGAFGNGSYTTKTKTFDGSTEYYVRFHCYNTTATRYVDDVSITYIPSAPAYTITAISNNDSYGTVSGTTTITATPEDGYRVVAGDGGYTVTSGTASVTNNGDNTFSVTPSTDCTIRINFEAIPTHTATFSVNGETTSNTYKEGANIVFPDDPDDISSKTFVGWVTDAIVGTTNIEPSFVTSATMSTSDVTYYAVFATEGDSSTTKTDNITRTTTGISNGGGYGTWSGKTLTSSAVYAGCSAGGNDAIQLNATSGTSYRGIISTTSGGTLSKVTITWNTNTTNDRSITVYGSNSAYTTMSAFDSSKGTELGSITKGTSTELTVTGSYKYVGFYASSAIYIDNIAVEWAVTEVSYSAYCTTVSALPVPTITFKDDEDNTITELDASSLNAMIPVSVICSAGDVTLSFESSDDKVAEYDDGYILTYDEGTATITATFAGNGSYQGTSAELLVTVERGTTTLSFPATPSTINIDATATYTATGSPSVSGITYSSNNTSSVTVNSTTGEITAVAKGTAKITASFAGNDNYKAAETDYTITVVDPNEIIYTLTNSRIVSNGPAATDGYGTKSITDENGKTWNAYAIKKEHSGATSDKHFLQIRAYNNPTAYYIQVPAYGTRITELKMTVSGSSAAMGSGGNSATLFFSADNTTAATGTGVVSGTGESTVTIDCSSLNLNTGYITASAAVRIWDVKVTYEYTLPVGSALWTTHVTADAVDFAGVTAFIAKKINAETVTLEEVTSAPANTPIIINGDASKTYHLQTKYSSLDDVSSNVLEASDGSVNGDGSTIFALGVGKTGANKGKVGFYLVDSGVQVPAGKAYLVVGGGAKEFLTFDFGDNADGINSLTPALSEGEGAIYNLAGQRISKMQKGINIVNGKKVLF